MAGGALEKAANGVFGNVFQGGGDYDEAVMGPDVVMNTLVHPTLREATPAFGAEDGHVILKRREYIGDITLDPNIPGPRIVQSLVINPGDSVTFPWLSRVAVQFEQYRLLGCVFEFKSTSTASTTNPNPALWSVSMATVYNVNTPQFSTKQQLLNHFFAVSGVASDNIIHPLECREELTSVTPKYVRVGPDAPFVSDARLQDVGRFCVMMSGGNVQAVRQTFGELWINYEVALLKPRVNQIGGFTYDTTRLEMPADPGVFTHVPELEELCCDEVEALRVRVAALEAEEKEEEKHE